MTISTYAELQTAVGNWLDDSSLTDRIPECIALAEARLNRTLRLLAMETAATLTASAETTALPTDFLGLRAIHVDGSPDVALEQMDLGSLKSRFRSDETGEPRAYAIAEGKFWWGPIPDGSYSVPIVYHAKIPALASASTNWLLTSHPDVYLYASLLQAEFMGWNDGRLPLIKAALDEALEELRTDSEAKRWGAAPLVPRMAVLG